MQKTIAVIGLGYIGLPTACLLARAGYQVIGVDIDKEKVQKVKQGVSILAEPGFDELFEQSKNNLTTQTEIPEAAAFIICVPTPLAKEKEPDLSYVESAVRSIAKKVKTGDIIIIESTVPPGTSKQLAKIIEDETSLRCDKDFYIAHCPERAFPGQLVKELINNDRVLGSDTSTGKSLVKEIYEKFTKGRIYLTNTTTAEFVKIIENTYRSTNIALANELAILAEDLDIDVHEAIALANRHPRVNIHMPGLGVGGHCIPIDPWFLLDCRKAPLIECALKINKEMVDHTIDLLKKGLSRVGKKLAGSKVAVLGVAYKPDVNDARETPTFPLIKKLIAEGAQVGVHDPLVTEFEYEICGLDEALSESDAIIISTAHSEYTKLDWLKIRTLMNTDPVVIDGRNLLKEPPEDFIYFGIGNIK